MKNKKRGRKGELEKGREREERNIKLKNKLLRDPFSPEV